jgi:1-aminocyclopropane-1-carboxylate synthase
MMWLVASLYQSLLRAVPVKPKFTARRKTVGPVSSAASIHRIGACTAFRSVGTSETAEPPPSVARKVHSPRSTRQDCRPLDWKSFGAQSPWLSRALSSTASLDRNDQPLATLCSTRGQQAVSLLPSYLADARQVVQYHPVTAPDGALQLGVAESKMLEDWLIPALQRATDLSRSDLPADCIYYQPTAGRLSFRQAMASYMTQLLNLPTAALDVENGLIVGAGCNAVLENLCHTLADVGDTCLIPCPYYAAFHFDLSARIGLRIQPMSTGGGLDDLIQTTTSGIRRLNPAMYYPTVSDLDAAYQSCVAATGKPPRILLLSHPTNPLGICYPSRVLLDCIDWCRLNQVHLISDEIYAGSVYGSGAEQNDEDEPPFTSVLKLAASSAAPYGLGLGPYVHWVYALSKDFALSGLRIGAVYTENELIQVPLQKLNDLCQIPSTTQIMVENLLSMRVEKNTGSMSRTASSRELWTRAFRTMNHERLRARGAALTAICEEFNVPYLSATAGLFLWMDLREYLPTNADNVSSPERRLYREMVHTYGLLLTPGESMDHVFGGGFFRCVFTAANDEEYALALQRLRHFFESKEAVRKPVDRR